MKENFTNLPAASTDNFEAGGKKRAFHLLEDFGKLELLDYKTKLANLGVSAEIIAEVEKNVDEALKIREKYSHNVNPEVMSVISLERAGVKYLRLDIFTTYTSFLINVDDNSFEMSDMPSALSSSPISSSQILAASMSTRMAPDSGPTQASSPDLNFYDRKKYDPRKR